MKKILFYAAIAATTLATFTGCTKKSDSSPSYTMKATVGSTAFSSSSCIAGQTGTLLTVVGGIQNGATYNFPYITLSMVNYNGAGTYNIDLLNNSASYAASLTDTKPAVRGSIVITAISPITGSFSFTLSDSTKVAGGSFTCKKP